MGDNVLSEQDDEQPSRTLYIVCILVVQMSIKFYNTK